MAVTYNTTNKTITQIYTASGGGTVFSGNLNGQAVFDYFTDTAVVNDAIYFSTRTGSGSGSVAWSDILVDVGTALSASSITIVWEFQDNTGNWIAITKLQDDTNGFQNTGANIVRFPYQLNWKYGNVNGITGTWIRARITAVTSITEGGANQTTAPYAKDGKVNINGYTDGSPCSFTIVSDYLFSNYAYLGQLRTGVAFDFRQIGLEINSRLKTKQELIETGNGYNSNYTIGRQHWYYIESGEKIGAESGKYGSTFIINASANTYPIYFSISGYEKFYGSHITSKDGKAGYPTMYGEYLDTTMEWRPGFRSSAVIKNCLFYLGGGIIQGSAFPSAFSNNKVILRGEFALCYQEGFDMDKIAYEFDGGSRFLYLYQTYTNIIFNIINPASPMPSQASSPRTAHRETRSKGDITHLYNYDNSGGFTDQTAEARNATVDDVNLTGKTGVPEVGDIIYFDRGGTNPYWADKEFLVTMGSVVNTDNVYIWEIYANGQWREARVWDCTEQFTKTGIVYASVRSLDDLQEAKTTINGVNSFWLRARIITAGNSKPLASQITASCDKGVCDWKIYEKYSLNQKVIDKEENGIGTVNVKVKDSIGAEKFSVNTDGNGDIAEQLLVAKSFYFDPINYPSNYQQIAEVTEGAYTIEISKAGYNTIKHKFTVDSKMKWVTKLKRISINADSEVIL